MTKYLSKKEFLKKEDSSVLYALYVLDNIHRDDYARLLTGQIVKVIGIRKNKIDKKAIYYGVHDKDWFSCSAVENFSDEIIDLIEAGDHVNGNLVLQKCQNKYNGNKILIVGNTFSKKVNNLSCLGEDVDVICSKDIKSVVTKEQFKSVKFDI